MSKKGEYTRHYQPFNKQDLKALFESEAYLTSQFPKAFQFWTPLIALYSGVRVNEAAQLALSDIKYVDGIACLDINDDEYRLLKNNSSVRTVPIHKQLIDAGFLDYVELLRGESYVRLFPELRMGRRKDGFGREVTKFFLSIEEK